MLTPDLGTLSSGHRRWDGFVSLDGNFKEKLIRISGPLTLAMAVLFISEDNFATPYLSAEEIQLALENVGIAVSIRTIVNALARSSNRVSRRVVDGITKYRVMAAGRAEVQPLLEESGIITLYIAGGRPRTAHRKLEEILSTLSGTARICDPYFGIRSLNTLEMFPVGCSIRLLTSNLTDKLGQLTLALADYRRERPGIEVRMLASPNILHDRYILWDDRVIFVGHGLKDIGAKESIVVSLSPDVAPGLAQELARSFDIKWDHAKPL